MIHVTPQFKEESLKNRNYYVTAKAVLADGTKLELKKSDFYLAGNGIVDSSDSTDFPIGVAIEKTATLSLVNGDGRFDAYNFNAAKFTIFLNLQLSDRLERVKRGTFIVSKKPATAEKISLTLLDYMHKADIAYNTKLTFPCTVREVLEDACQQAGIVLGDAIFPNSDFQIKKAPSNTTVRAVIGMAAALAGGNARIDEDDLLRILPFKKEFISGEYHKLTAIRSLRYDVDDIVVTGVKYIEDEKEYLAGREGYVIVLENQLLSGNAQAGVEAIGARLIGLRMRPFSCSGIANGYATFGDPVEFRNTKGRTFRSYITDTEFVFGGSTLFSCKAKSAEEDLSIFENPNQGVVEQAKQEVEKGLSAYDTKLKQMNELAANTLGFYYTEEKQPDGSVISYRHDKPTLETSKVVYKSGIEGFFLSVDGGKTWKAGFDSNGDAVLNILYAIGIQAEWINTRGLTAKDNTGDITFRVDANTGNVVLNVESFTLKGKTIEQIAKEQAGEVTVPNYYGSYKPTLSNRPASEWKAEEYASHDRSIFMDFLNNKIYMFSAAEKTWKELDIKNVVTFEDVFNALTNNGQWEGLFMRDGHLYMNASYIKAGQIAAEYLDLKGVTIRDSLGNVTFAVDNYGNVAIRANTFSLQGSTIQNIANGAANNALDSAKKYTDGQLAVFKPDVNLTQQEIFNILTNNGQTQGIYLYGGKIYINADYIDTGYLAGWRIDSANDCLYTGNSAGGAGITLWGSGKIQSLYGSYDTTIEGGKIKSTLIDARILKVTQEASFTGTSSSGVSFSNYNTVFDGSNVKFNATQVTFNSAGGNAPQFMKPPKLYNLTHVTKGGHLVFASDGATLAYLSPSSKRYKDHIAEMSLEDAEKILDIPVVWFKYKEGYLEEDDLRNGKPVPGFYAEDVYEHFPDAADLNADGTVEDWNYRELIPPMLKLIQEQDKKIKTLEQQIEGLENKIRGDKKW